MEFNLSRKISKQAKPVIRQRNGEWVVFCMIGVTDTWAANKATDWIRKANSNRRHAS